MKTIISAIKFWTTEKINEETILINNKIDSIDTEMESMNQNFDNKLKNSVADWSINDENDNGYIKNRPFYENNDRILFWSFEYSEVTDHVRT